MPYQCTIRMKFTSRPNRKMLFVFFFHSIRCWNRLNSFWHIWHYEIEFNLHVNWAQNNVVGYNRNVKWSMSQRHFLVWFILRAVLNSCMRTFCTCDFFWRHQLSIIWFWMECQMSITKNQSLLKWVAMPVIYGRAAVTTNRIKYIMTLLMFILILRI